MNKNGVAVHPRTGKPIKVMTLETQIHKDQKTLHWVYSAEEAAAQRRWKTVSVGAPDIGAAFKIWDGHIWLKGQEIPLKGLEELYPFLGGAWDGTNEDAVLILAGLLRFQRIAGFPAGCGSTAAASRADLLRALGVEFLAAGSTQPEPLWLIQQYYKPAKERRAREIRKCLEKNLEQTCIDKIILLNERPEKLPASEKLEEHIIGRRLTYRDVVQYVYEKVPAGVRVAFSNSDIWLDSWDTAGSFWDVDMHNKFLALMRYESDTGKLFGQRADSQDCWVVHSDSVKSRKWDWAALDFPFGQMGCDNSITTEFVRQKFLVANPCITLKTIHEHTSQVRTYERTDVVEKQIFFYVEPSGIHDMEVITDLSAFAGPALEIGESERRLRSINEAGLKTWVTMTNREEGQRWSTESLNIWKDPKEVDYKLKSVCVTNNGLLYDYDAIYVGTAKEAWAKTPIHPLTPLESSDYMLAVPFEGKEQLDDYGGGGFMKYLARILRVWGKGAEGEFWVGGDEAVSWLRLFEWGTPNVPVMAWNDSGACWAKEAIWTGWRRPDAPLYERDVRSLRASLKGWVRRSAAATATKKLVGWGAAPWFSLSDGDWHGIEMGEEEIRWVHTTTHTPEEIRDALVGATEFYMKTEDSCPFLWMLPIGCRTVEVQNEMKVSWRGVHEAGLCGLEHWFVFEPRALPAAAAAAVQKGIVETRAKWRGAAGGSEKPDHTLPVLIMPEYNTTGFYGHQEDTFRELAKEWERAGYVRIVRDGRASLCWLNAIGDVLLYDRPTLAWLDRATLTEKSWRVGLFGNPAAPTGGRSWTFWGRRPAMLEAVRPLGWEDRKRGLVFYGKCENKVQTDRREGDWAKICDEYIMARDGQKYPMTNEEYLARLGEAKWGLCLPGYGWKCNREIECLALGVVPVCAPGVDMENYAEPLVEGVHYLRLGAAGAESWVEPDRATWERMSAAGRSWWERNCSVAGSWELTRRLAKV